MTVPRPELKADPRARAVLAGLVAVGALAFGLGALRSPERAWSGLLLVSWALIGFGLGGLFFVALQHVTGAVWSVVLRRLGEAMTAALPAGALGLAAVLLARPSIYPWVLTETENAGGYSGFKHAWLSLPFFAVRAAIYLLLWLAFARLLVRASRRQDDQPTPAAAARNSRLSASFLVVFAPTFCLASFDWVMSLEPGWYSTIFGIYNFAGLFLSALAAMALLALWLRRTGPLAGLVSEAHLLDLGRLVFAFSTFWAYIWFCQFMLIWYANLPEEAAYFVRRQAPGWAPLFVLNLALNWVLPFAILLPRASKRSPRLLGTACAIVLLGRLLDLFLMVAPPLVGARPALGLWELGMALGLFGLLAALVLRSLRQAPLIPVGDPALAESLHHHA